MSAESTVESKEPKTKKLRSGGEPDLEVWVGGGGDKTVFHYHSLLLATHSEYVDTMLASPMVERESRSLSFPDIEPPVWEKMLAVLEDPMACRQVTVDDALQVFPFYDKYQFPKGIKLCDHVFHEFVVDDIPAANLDKFIDVCIMAGRVNAGKAKKVCLQHLQGVVCRSWLTEGQINRLIPLITKEQVLLDAIGMTKEEVLSPLVHRFWQTRHQLLAASKTLILTGGYFHDVRCRREHGNFYRDDTTFTQISVKRDEAANWTVFYSRSIVWVCPQSKHLDVPPCEGWVVVDDSISARGDYGPLKIAYSSN